MRFLAILSVGFLWVVHLAEGKTTRTVTITIVERGAASSVVASAVTSAVATPSCAPYWLELVSTRALRRLTQIRRIKSRNVKDFGAKGDGITDDTTAINLAISSGGRCGPGCASSSTTPAIVYFPPGTYIISSSIVDYYYTQLIGNPNCLPVLKATPGITGLGIIDGNQYQSTGGLAWGSTDVFWRQIGNFVLDMTAVPPGSGGMMNDLVFYGGLRGASIGSQQFTMRNITFNNSVTAIYQLWDWGWTYKSIYINNCSIGIDITALGTGGQEVGSITLFDSTISNTAVGISTAHTLSQTGTRRSMFLENVQLNNVPIAIQGAGPTTILPGTAGLGAIPGWGQGHAYTPGGPVNFQGPVPPLIRPPSLLKGSIYYERSKPQYETASIHKFRSTREGGAKGDGNTDDTTALQATINNAATSGDIVFFDAGTYKITDTLYIPRGSKLVGEASPVIMSSGSKFADMDSPRAVVAVGKTGEEGAVECMIVSTHGAQAWAILIQWNLTTPASAPSGMWDVHTRVGGFKGSEFQDSQCPTTPNTVVGANSVVKSCIGAFMMMHIAPSASGLYLENVWHWTADHDLDDPALVRITVYSSRGLHVESGKDNIWL
ncbi:MAG: hypothetical protein M1840_009028 [Geoglossum simile]|nr:MAG: hypothetical protein M1840_009028 [Geoglossum simile]